MNARIVQLADAVTAALNGQVEAQKFCRAFVAERSYADLEMLLQATDELKVDVIPLGHVDAELLDRFTVGYQSALLIGIRYKFAGAHRQSDGGRVALSEVDPLIHLLEEIYEFLAKKRFCDSVWKSARIRSAVNHKMLRDMGQFFATIEVRFLVPGELA